MIKVFPERLCDQPVQLTDTLDLDVLRTVIAQKSQQAGVPLQVEKDQMRIGKGLAGAFSDIYDCVAVYHPQHRHDYYCYVIIIHGSGTGKYVSVYLGGDSANYRNTLLDGSGVISSVVKNRARVKLMEEEAYYDEVKQVISESLVDSLGRSPVSKSQPQPAPRPKPKAEPAAQPTRQSTQAPKTQSASQPKAKVAAAAKTSRNEEQTVVTTSSTDRDDRQTTVVAPKPNRREKQTTAPAQQTQQQNSGSCSSRTLAWILWVVLAIAALANMGVTGLFLAGGGVLLILFGESLYQMKVPFWGSLLITLGSFLCSTGLLTMMTAAGVVAAIVCAVLDIVGLKV